MTVLEGIGLGALQGITEFLPISSSGHLVLARSLLGVTEAPVTLEVLLHAASLVAILVYFRREVASLFTVRRWLLAVLVVGTLPAAVVGVLLKDRLEGLFENPLGVGIGLLFTGTVLWVSERMARGERRLDELRWGDGFWIGVAQAIAIVPGVSRSGMTIGAGLASGLERASAMAFAFLLGAVAIGGATALKLKDVATLGALEPVPMVCGFVASLVMSLVALGLLDLVLRRKRLSCFTLYCYLVGGAVLVAKLTGLW